MVSSDQVLFIILIVIIIASFIVGYFQYKKRIELLTYQAEKRGGEVIAKNLFSRTRLLLPYRGEKNRDIFGARQSLQPAKDRRADQIQHAALS